MSIQYKFFKNDNGYSKAVVEPPYEYVSALLGSDVRSDFTINQILDIIEKLQNGDLESTAWRQTYNAHNLTLTPLNAFIEPMYSDTKPCVVPIDDFKQLMKDWLIYITQKNESNRI